MPYVAIYIMPTGHILAFSRAERAYVVFTTKRQASMNPSKAPLLFLVLSVLLAGTTLSRASEEPFQGKVGKTLADSEQYWP